MPAIDQCEPQVIRAFEKANWIVTANPLSLPFRDAYVYADLRLQNAQQQNELIVVEVKCFPANRSQLDELYHALGQYQVYREALALSDYQISLYLVVPQAVYDDLLMVNIIQNTLKRAKINLVVVNLDEEEITQWVTW